MDTDLKTKPQKVAKVRKAIEKPQNKAEEEEDKNGRRPPLNFKELDILPGAKLMFRNNPEVQVEVISDCEVKYMDKVYKLTPLTQRLLHTRKSLQPSPYWLYQFHSLKDLYEEKYKK